MDYAARQARRQYAQEVANRLVAEQGLVWTFATWGAITPQAEYRAAMAAYDAERG